MRCQLLIRADASAVAMPVIDVDEWKVFRNDSSRVRRFYSLLKAFLKPALGLLVSYRTLASACDAFAADLGPGAHLRCTAWEYMGRGNKEKRALYRETKFKEAGFDGKRQRPTRNQAPSILRNVDVHGILFAIVLIVFVIYPLAQWALGL